VGKQETHQSVLLATRVELCAAAAAPPPPTFSDAAAAADRN